MLGVLKRRLKPKRNSGGRKTKEKDKCHSTDGSSDVSVSPRETRSSRTVRDTRQVHPEKESDKIGVLGHDYQILSSAGQKDGMATTPKGGVGGGASDPQVKDALLSSAHLLNEFQKESTSPPLPVHGANEPSSCFKDATKDDVMFEACGKHATHTNGTSANGFKRDGGSGKSSASLSPKVFETDTHTDVVCDRGFKQLRDEVPPHLQMKQVKRDHHVLSSCQTAADQFSEVDCNVSSFMYTKSQDNHVLDSFCENVDTSDPGANGPSDSADESGDVQKTSDDESNDSSESEKMDVVKECLEKHILELKKQLEEQKEQLRKEQTLLSQLQLEASSVHLKEEIEHERRLRIDAETRLREVSLECEHCKARAASLQEDFHKMEEMVCNMLQFKLRIDQLKQEKSSLSIAYENQIRKYESCIDSLEKENLMLMKELKTLEATNKEREEEHERSLSLILMERMKLLEQENASLVVENEQQRQQYERCLDDVANQVVQALLAQKNLKEECEKLQRKVQDLEHQNRALTTMFKQRFLYTTDCAVSCGKDRLQYPWPSCSGDSKSPEDDFGQEFSTGLRNIQCMSPLGNGGQRNCPVGVHTSRVHRQAEQDSPEPTSQSEDSTESLASICSEYSFNSGSSGGNLLSQPGLPKMSSPPQWLRDRISNTSGDVASVALTSKLLLTGIQHRHYHLSASKEGAAGNFGSRSKLRVGPRSELLGRVGSLDGNSGGAEPSGSCSLLDSSHVERCTDTCQQSTNNITRVRRHACSETSHHHNVEQFPLQNKEFLGPEKARLHCGGLDVVETPNDECFAVDRGPTYGATQKHSTKKSDSRANDGKASDLQPCSLPEHANSPVDVSVLHLSHTPSLYSSGIGKSASKVPNSSLYSCGASLMHSSGVEKPLSSSFLQQRPNTLNVIPHTTADPLHRFCLSSLGLRSHVVSSDMYKGASHPQFSFNEDQKVTLSGSSKQAFPGADFLRDDMNTVVARRKGDRKWVQKTSACEEEFLSNTVLRRLPGSQASVMKSEMPPSHLSLASKQPTNKVTSPNSSGLSPRQGHSQMPFGQNSKSNPNVCQTCHMTTHLAMPKSPLLENDSPMSIGDGVERGNKDEGYSTMSSDVQSDLAAVSSGTRGSIHDLTSTQHSPVCIAAPDLSREEHPMDGDTKQACISSVNVSSAHRSGETRAGKDVWCLGFEHRPDSSVVRKDRMNSLTTIGEIRADDSAESKSDDQMTQSSSIGDASVETQMTTIKMNESHTIEDIVDSLGFQDRKASSLSRGKHMSSDPSYDKLLLLLTPQGFKPCKRESRRVTLPLVHTPSGQVPAGFRIITHKVETAEKSTITDLEDVSTESDPAPVRKMLDACTIVDELLGEKSAEGRCSLICDPSPFVIKEETDVFPCHVCSSYHKNSHHQYESPTVVASHKKVWPNPVDCENALCLQNNARSRWPQRRSMFLLPSVRETEEVHLLQRASSDSHLFLRGFMHNRHCTCTSLVTSVDFQHPEVHLGILPLEEHNSACELSSHSLAASTTITPPLRRSKRQILIEHPTAQAQWLKSEQSSPHSPTVSLSSVQTSVTEEGSGEEEEELGAISLKCSHDHDISSVSSDEQDLLEQRNLVEKWLQGGTEMGQEPRPNSSEEEDIDSWKMPLMKQEEEEQQCATEKSEAMTSSSINSYSGKKNLPSHELERIEELGLEEDYPENFWNETSWENVGKVAEESAITNDQLHKEVRLTDKKKTGTPESPIDIECNSSSRENQPHAEEETLPTDWLTADNISPSYKPISDLEDEEVCNEVNDILGQTLEDHHANDGMKSKEDEKKVEGIPEIMSPTDVGGQLSKETKEFKRDFYRLCAIGSSRSLTVSESDGFGEHETLNLSASSPVISSHSYEADSPILIQEEKQLDEPKEVDETEITPADSAAVDSLTKPATLPDIATEGTAQNEEGTAAAADTTKKQPSTDNSSPCFLSTDLKAKPDNHVTATPVVKKRERCSRKPPSEMSESCTASELIRCAGSEKTKIPITVQGNVNIEKPKKHSRKLSTSKSPSAPSDAGKRRHQHDDKIHPSSQRPVERIKDRREHHHHHHHSRKSSAHSQDQSCRKGPPSVDGKTPSKAAHRESNRTSKNDSKSNKKSTTNQEQPKLAEKFDCENKQEITDLSVDDLERKFTEKGEEMTVADKIQELTTFLSKSKTALNLLDSSKGGDSAVGADVDNAEAQDSSLERRKTIQKKEKALREGNGTKEGFGTSWVHLEADIDLSDPKARANLLDSMMASSSSSGSEEEEGDGDVMEHKYHQRLHAIHRIRRHRKRATDRDAVISFIPRIRTSIINRQDFFCRFGEKEKEAISCFDFLEELSTSPSDGDPSEGPQAEGATHHPSPATIQTSLNDDNMNAMLPIDEQQPMPDTTAPDETVNANSPSKGYSLDDSMLCATNCRLVDDGFSTTTLSQDGADTVDHISLSDSCAESYTSSTQSLNHIN